MRVSRSLSSSLLAAVPVALCQSHATAWTSCCCSYCSHPIDLRETLSSSKGRSMIPLLTAHQHKLTHHCSVNRIDRLISLKCTRTTPLVTGYRTNQSTRRASLSANLSCNGFSPSTIGALSKGWRVCTASMPDYWYDRTWAVYEKIVRLDHGRSSTVSQAQERDRQTVRLRPTSQPALI